MMKPMLVALDFDHTIVDENTDIVVQKLVPKEQISQEIRKLYRSDGWTSFMQEIFHLLHKNGIMPEMIRDAVVKIPATPGMSQLLQHLHQAGAEVVIVSDSNSVFIDEWLRASQLLDTINRVFTNPAHYDDAGHLSIEMYHYQDWCQLSSKNLCKGHILESYLSERAAEGVTFSRVAYVGDGKNDLCPSLRLSENDLTFAREGLALQKSLKELQEQNDTRLRAQVHIWQTGEDILSVVSKLL